MQQELTHFMHLMSQRKASDSFFSAGAPPSMKVEGITSHIGTAALSAEEVRSMAYSVMSDKQQKEFEATMEMNLSIVASNSFCCLTLMTE